MPGPILRRVRQVRLQQLLKNNSITRMNLATSLTIEEEQGNQMGT